MSFGRMKYLPGEAFFFLVEKYIELPRGVLGDENKMLSNDFDPSFSLKFLYRNPNR